MSWKRALPPALLALAFAGVELLTAPTEEPALGVEAGDVLAAVGVLVVLHVSAVLACGRLGGRALVVPVVLWSMVWGPEQARRRGLPVAAGWAAPLVLAAVGVRAPAVAAGLSLAGGIAPRGPTTGAGSCRDCPDLVLVTVDTVRGDAALASAMPGADWQVGSAIAPAPWTPPAMHSILLGAPVLVHGGGVETSQGVTARPDSFIGLAESLESLGFSTAAFVSNPHLREEAGFRKGFSVWAHAARAPAPMLLLRTGRMGMARWFGRRRAAGQTDQELVDAARRWLRRTQDGGRFLWLHLMGPHAWPREEATGEAPRDDSPVERRRRYGAHVDATRARLSRFWQDVPSGATVVLTSDHGEALGESGVWGHGRSLDPVLLSVPLAIRSPTLRLPDGPARLTGLRAGFAAAAGKRPHTLQEAEGAILGGVRGAPQQAGVWRSGAVTHREVRGASSSVIAPLDVADRDALHALGYFDDQGGTQP